LGQGEVDGAPSISTGHAAKVQECRKSVKKRQSMDGSNMVTISLHRKLATHLQRRWDLEKQNGKGPPRRKQWVGPFVLLILSRILAGVWNLGQLVKPQAQT